VSELPETCLSSTVNVAIVNALWTIMTGESYSLDDPRILRTVQTLGVAIRSTERFSTWVYYFPGLARRVWKGYKMYVRLTLWKYHS
jgi:hypothetical protein